MKTKKLKMMILPIVVAVFAVVSIGWFFLNRYLNEPTRVIESMLNARVNFDANPNLAKKYFEQSFLSEIDVDKPATKPLAHTLKNSRTEDRDIVAMSISKSKDGTASSTDIIKFYLNRHGFYPWLYWTRIEKTELTDVRYLSDFSNIVVEPKLSEKKIGEKFALSGRFEVSLENFEDLSQGKTDDRVSKYSFDISYKTKPVDFKVLSVFVTLVGENGITCLKSQPVEISDLSKDSQTVRLTVLGGFCQPTSIKIEGSMTDSVKVNLK